MSMLDKDTVRHDLDRGRHARRLSRRAARLLIHQELVSMWIEREMDLDAEIRYLERYIEILSA